MKLTVHRPALFAAEQGLRKYRRCLLKTLLIMKITAIILLASTLQLSAAGYSQTVSLDVKNATVKEILKEIKKQTGYTFVYTTENLNQARNVSIHVTNASVEEVLNICFKDQPFSYKVIDPIGKIITIAKKNVNEQNNVENELFPPNDISGKIFDEDGNPLVGANVKVKGTNNGTSTNENGEFILKGVDEKAVLEVSYVGFETQYFSISGKNSLLVKLLKKISPLDETQVIAYGTTTQRFNTGSVTKITSEDIARQPISNPLAAIQGRVPGLIVSATSGLPGASFNVQVRGQNSLNPSDVVSLKPVDNPLIIIDGVPFAQQNINMNQFRSILAPGENGFFNNNYGGVSAFSSLNPSDIESIEVLRDADATAIYGSRGANGVIIVTTKKGKAGKTNFGINVFTGTSMVGHSMPMMNTDQYLEMRREAFKNDAIIPNINAGDPGFAPDLLIFDSSRYTDWKKYFIGNSSNTLDASVSLSGGTGNTQFFVGSGYHRETYLFPGDYSNSTASVNTNISHRSLNKKLTLTLSANYSYNKNNSSNSPDLLSAYLLEPNYPELLDNQGAVQWNYNGISLSNYTRPNPMAYILQKYSINSYNLISNLQLAYSILPELIVRSNFGYNSINSEEYSGNPKSSYDPSLNIVASADFGNNKIHSWIIEPQAEFIKQIKKAKLDFLVGSTFQQNTNYSNTISGSGYLNDALIGSVSAAPVKNASDNYSLYKYSGFFGRLNFNISNKYILNISGRRDGSSRFGPNKQFGNFGSIGAGWIFSEENFIKKNLSIISYGKVRVSYGSTGNDGVGNYQYIPRWSPTGYSYQGSLGFLPQNLNNPEFSWAVTKKFEAALEFGVFRDKLIGNVAWYRNRSNNQLVTYPLPSQTGFGGVVENWSALVQNTGWEFQLISNNIKNKSLSWSTSFNLTIPRNKLVSFPNIDKSNYAKQYIVGQSLSVLNKFEYLGVNDTTGVFQFLTSSKAPTYKPIDYTDYKIIGNLDPKFFGGLGNTFTYKNIELYVFVEFKKQLGTNYLGQVYRVYVPGFEANQPTEFLNRWQNPGDQSQFQKFTSQVSTDAGIAARNYFVQSSGIYSDASYIRFKTVSLSYKLSATYLKNVKMKDCAIYIHAQNLFTITHYKGNDPETQNFYGIPPLRTITAGARFTF